MKVSNTLADAPEVQVHVRCEPEGEEIPRAREHGPVGAG